MDTGQTRLTMSRRMPRLAFTIWIEPEGHTFSQIPQPTQLSVMRNRCCHVSGGIWLMRSRNSWWAARSRSVTGEIQCRRIFISAKIWAQLILHLFIQQHLFPHVKTGQSIIYHQHHIDIGYRNAALPAKLMGQFGGTAMPVSISKDHVEILCLESCLFKNSFTIGGTSWP